MSRRRRCGPGSGSSSELEVARLIQQNFLPKELPDLPGWQVAAYYRPARAVGGDFYDFIELPEGKVGLVVGDVTDKGVPAAMVMAATRSVLRASAQRIVAPGEVLETVNDLLCPDIPPKMFVTCLYGVLDPETGLLRFANAGHNLPFARTPSGPLELRATGMPLGLMPGMTYEEREAVLTPGESILLYSDGVTEAHNPGREMFGGKRLGLPRRRAAGGHRADRRHPRRARHVHRPGLGAGGRHHDGRAPANRRRRGVQLHQRGRAAYSPSSRFRASRATSARS